VLQLAVVVVHVFQDGEDRAGRGDIPVRQA
jgi:hypothetical protein